MKKIIPFKKKLEFKTNINEIVSISLENTLSINDNKVIGDLIIDGKYKITETSINVDDFEFKIPVEIEIDSKYIIDKVITDIDDFYYEIINNNILEVNIDVMLDNLEEKEQPALIEQPIYVQQIKEFREETKEMETKEERCIELEEKEKHEINIFENFNDESDTTSTYYVYIVREGDTIEQIQDKYKTTLEQLTMYNDLTELKLGDKIIIPENKNAKN